MRKIEKPTIKHKTIESTVSSKEASVADNPYGNLDEVFPEVKGRLTYVHENDFERDDFRPPSGWYVLTPMGGKMYIRCQKRSKAQEIADYAFQGRFKVVPEIKAAIR